MKSFLSISLMLASVALLLTGCAAKEVAISGKPDALMNTDSMARTTLQGQETEFQAGRMLTWKAHLTIKVGDVNESMRKAIAITEEFKGYAENKSYSGEKSATVRLRIPADAFKNTVSAIELLGDISYRSVTAEDVTEQYVDVEARLKNKKELRDRLRQLLQKATNVKDIIMIETELNRVQSDIDSMEARIRSLKGRVDYATVELTLERKKVLGPVGYILQGLWWGIEKLFVIRD